MNWQIFNAPEYLNLKSCLFSGQVFSFYIDTNKKHKENLIDFIKKNNFLESIKENNIANLEIFNGLINKTEYLLCQFNNLIFYSTDDKESIKNLNIFFGFNLRYKKIFKNWEFEYNGLRLLRIDIVENILSFVCSQNNNIRRISKMVIYLREKSDNFRVLDFDEDDLRKEGFGYRAKYIMNVCKEINKLQDIENSKMEYKENVENQIEENFKLQDKENIRMDYNEIIKFQPKKILNCKMKKNVKWKILI
ncbi:8-oxoguanine glycosylase ogg1 [Gurleya vavrai]